MTNVNATFCQKGLWCRKKVTCCISLKHPYKQIQEKIEWLNWPDWPYCSVNIKHTVNNNTGNWKYNILAILFEQQIEFFLLLISFEDAVPYQKKIIIWIYFFLKSSNFCFDSIPHHLLISFIIWFDMKYDLSCLS